MTVKICKCSLRSPKYRTKVDSISYKENQEYNGQKASCAWVMEKVNVQN